MQKVYTKFTIIYFYKASLVLIRCIVYVFKKINYFRNKRVSIVTLCFRNVTNPRSSFRSNKSMEYSKKTTTTTKKQKKQKQKTSKQKNVWTLLYLSEYTAENAAIFFHGRVHRENGSSGYCDVCIATEPFCFHSFRSLW